MKKYISKLTRDDIKSILKVYGKQLLGIGFLIGFLLFLLNIFLSLSIYTSNFSDTLQDRLGIYFYIRDIPGEENITYKKIITLKEELESQGLRVAFSSKEDAFGFLEKRVPELINNLKKFDIANPLPATLYVMFKNDSQYQILKQSILKYKEIVLNVNDISQGDQLKQQENRTLTIINFTNFIKIVSYVFILVIGLIIITFLLFLVNSIFNTFYSDLSIKKTLGATSRQINETFLLVLFKLIGLAFIINIILLSISGYVTGFYLQRLFDFDLLRYISDNIFEIIVLFVIEFTIILGIGFYSSSTFIKTLNRKLK